MDRRKRGPYKKQRVEATELATDLPGKVLPVEARVHGELNKAEILRPIPQDDDQDDEQDTHQDDWSMHVEELPSTLNETAICNSNEVNRVIINENNVNILNQYNPSITDDQNHDDEFQYQENLLAFSDELLTADSDMYADENAIFLPEEVANEEADETAKLSNDCDPEEEKTEPHLYAGTSKKLGLVLLLICSLSIRFKISDEGINYIISLIAMILPSGNNMIRSVYALKEYLKKFVSVPKVHFLCSWCGSHVAKDETTCSNKYCSKDLTKPGSIGYFIQHSVINQLQTMCRRNSFLEKIRSHRFKHYENNISKHICDVYDGSNYKKAFERGFLNDPNTISFSINTDGVQIFKSSTVSMWPVFMTINELPMSERVLKENIIYYGLWIASKKPMMWSYLKPLHEELKQLEEGVIMEDANGDTFKMRATILNCVCDLPARCLVSNSMQFNGKYGCWFCLQPGETYTTNKGGHVHVYPFQENDPKGPRRTVENVEQDVNEVVKNIQEDRKNYVVRGVKGPFWFMFLQHFNVIHGFVIDYMHGICAGVMKLLLVLWFDKQHKNEPFSVHHLKSKVSKRLQLITPNIQITRPPRSLDDLGHWKSSEFRNFLFLWSLPVLHDILPAANYIHFVLLVKAIYNLSKECITEHELANAEKCLTKFVENFSELYSLRFLTMNCHQLLHITDCVKSNGPLFANNCFIFENLNGYILKHIHGPTGVEMQIINALIKMQAIPSMADIYVKKGTTDETLLNSILRPNYIHNEKVIETGIFLLGQTFKKRLSEDEFIAVSHLAVGFSPSVVEFRKIFISKCGCPVYGTEYKRLHKRNQSVVKYADVHGSLMYGIVKTFIQVDGADNNILNFAMLHPALPTDSDLLTESCSQKVIIQLTEIKAVPIMNILKVCTIVNVDNVAFITEFPNKYEKD